MSRQELADAVNRYLFGKNSPRSVLTANYIGKLERGVHRWPHHEYRAAFRAVLDVTTDAALGFFIVRKTPVGAEPPDREQGDEAPPRPAATDDDRPAGTVATHVDTSWAGMLRRTVLKLPAALAVTQLAGTAVPAEVDDPLDPELARGLLAVAGNYRRAYQAVPASRLLPAAQTHLDLLMSLRIAGRPEDERRPFVIAAGETAALAGVLLALDAARHEQALAYFDMTWSAARSVNDIELQAVVLGCRSFAVAYGNGDHRAGLECADFARQVAATGASPQTRAWVAAVASERCASLDDLAGCQARLDESRASLASTKFADVAWRGIGGFDADKLRAYEGGDLMRLRRFKAAEGLLDAALNGLAPTMARHRATALLDRADARLGMGEIEAACVDARDALSLVTDVEHTSHLDRIEDLSARGRIAGSRAADALGHEVRLTRLDHGLPIRQASG